VEFEKKKSYNLTFLKSSYSLQGKLCEELHKNIYIYFNASEWPFSSLVQFEYYWKTIPFKGQADLHCKGERTQSLEELIEYWEWVWLSQRSSWSSALCYFCENKRRMRDNMRRTAKNSGGRRVEVMAFREAATFPCDTWDSSLRDVVNAHAIT